MTLFIPAGLRKNAENLGVEGALWLRSLPDQIIALEQQWGFRTGEALDHGGVVSWVAPVELIDGTEAILKIGIPHFEAQYESAALRFLNGDGAVRLLQASEDGFSLLLERCRPGTDLWSLSDAEADAIACALLPRLWREPGEEAPYITLSELVAMWSDEVPGKASSQGYDDRLVNEVLALGRDLAASQPRQALLHGDFHPGNVLAAEREPWLMIDPKPIVGDPAFDIAQWLYNRQFRAVRSDDPLAMLRDEIEMFADNLRLDGSRIAGWALVKALCWDCGPDVVDLLRKVVKEA